MIIRPYHPHDLSSVLKLFYETVHTVNAADYHTDILNAWAPKELDTAQWHATLSNNYTIVAILDNSIVGFGTLHDLRYIHYLFVHMHFQGKKIGSMLFDALEACARQHGITTLKAEATITSKPFFERKGFRVIRSQTTQVKGHKLANFVMEKKL